MTGLIAERPGTTTASELEPRLAEHRRELTGYCYRMLGSAFDAEDAVQETMVRAWRSLDRLQGSGALRSWLYRIATNVCLDSLDGRKRRALPVDLSEDSFAPVEASLDGVLPDGAWVEPALDRQVLPVGGDPADLAVQKESVRLAFVAALQFLPPRQRAVLILRDVLRWKADEVAVLLETSVAAVNSALQRARATLAVQQAAEEPAAPTVADDHAALLDRYLDAFARYDIDALVALLHEDAVMDMPPYAMWLRSSADIATWFVGPGAECRGSHVVPLELNGNPAFAQWRPSGPNGEFEPWAVHALQFTDGRVTRMTAFLDTRLFDLFGLPRHPTPA
ncbi:sigma-70 family RNA polymerase sigma factor [Modestobacter versicolor]|uniref:RNA polymerase sigma-70 factor (ECF subfamily) n=1 Tax=Modestobacter versicolor TaxID=429133 RepID=A0A323VC98_9ACTN|nr:sigma-70 family RNA polymerase sigma factor [Modestobacter versicolor]MBB3675962.1 RNA polymerase sigma-70 factor (ECF subfamily) [Modestobacter versicolor]PZA22367.1 RNA polymerase subunit sigma-70 [Modestobacter versicolor]